MLERHDLAVPSKLPTGPSRRDAWDLASLLARLEKAATIATASRRRAA